MNVYKELKKLQKRIKCCCNGTSGGGGGGGTVVYPSYPSVTAAQNDPALPVGSLYYLDGTVPGSGFKGEAYIKY